MLLAGCGGGSSGRATSVPSPSPTPIVPTAKAIAPSAVRTVAVGSKPCAATYDGVDVWVSLYGDDEVVALEPRTGRVRRTLRTGLTPCGLQVSDGLLWVGDVSAGTVEALDRRTGHRKHLVDVGGEIWDVRAAGGVVWADDHDSALVRIDPTTGRSRKIDLGTGSVPSGLAADAHGVWVAAAGVKSVLRVDLTGKVVRRVPVGVSPTWFADDGQTLGVSDPSRQVEWLLDPASGVARSSLPVPGMANDGDAAGGVIYEPESSSGNLWRIDTKTGRATLLHPPAPLTVVEVLDGAVWGLEYRGSRVVRIEPSGLR